MDQKNTKKIVKLNPESCKKNPSQFISSTAMPEIESLEDDFSSLGKANQKLELEKDHTKRSDSYYRQAIESQKENLNDVIIAPSHKQRLMASVIDYSLVCALFITLNILVVDKLNLVARFNYNSRLMFLSLFFASAFGACFIPTLFIKNTIGKKIMKIKIRGRKYYNPNVFQYFFREAVLKPLSIVTFVGIYLFFMEKESLGAHSNWSATQLTLD